MNIPKKQINNLHPTRAFRDHRGIFKFLVLTDDSNFVICKFTGISDPKSPIGIMYRSLVGIQTFSLRNREDIWNLRAGINIAASRLISDIQSRIGQHLNNVQNLLEHNFIFARAAIEAKSKEAVKS